VRKPGLKSAVASVLFLLLVGCGGTSTPSTGARTVATHDADLGGFTATAPKHAYRLGVAIPHFLDPYWVALVYGEIDEAQRWGATVDVVYSSGGYDQLPKQVSQVEDLIQKKEDAILFSPDDYAGSAAVVAEATAAKIPVINVANFSKSAKVSAAVNNYDSDIGARMADFIGTKKPDAKVVMLAGPAGADWSMGRVQGFKDEAKNKYPNLQILAEKTTNVDRNDAQKATEDWIQAFPRIDAVMSVAAPLGEGASLAMKAAGKRPATLVVTSTLNSSTLGMLKTGDVDYVQSEQPVMIGRIGVQLAFKVLNGEALTYPQKGTLSSPPHIYWIDSPSFTAANVGQATMANNAAPTGWSPPQ
jgi:ABC-type sugar transport system substrate-binding protein